MNPFSAFFSLIGGIFQTVEQSEEERDQQGPEGRAYDASLDRNGYEGQYQVYFKEHGTHDGFVYKDPGDMPEGWRP
jgi:hypothetical protein